MIYRLGMLNTGLVALAVVGGVAGVVLHPLQGKTSHKPQHAVRKVCNVPPEYRLRPDCWHGTEDEFIATWIAAAEADKKAERESKAVRHPVRREIQVAPGTPSLSDTALISNPTVNSEATRKRLIWGKMPIPKAADVEQKP